MIIGLIIAAVIVYGVLHAGHHGARLAVNAESSCPGTALTGVRT